MKVKEAIERRRSVRSFQEKEVPRRLLEEVMDSVRMAPSASNRQDWKFVIVEDDSVKNQLYKAANEQTFVREAPFVIAGVATEPEDKMSCGVKAGIVDMSIALDHLTLRATEKGLGTCWIGAFDQEKTKKVLEIPPEYEVIALMPLGYPTYDLTRENKRRKKLEEIISYNKFQED